jgi:hypothetical protein
MIDVMNRDADHVPQVGQREVFGFWSTALAAAWVVGIPYLPAVQRKSSAFTPGRDKEH